MPTPAPRLAALLMLLCAGARAGDEIPAADPFPFGFRGFELYKLDHQIAQLTACDVDGDGLRDLLVVNNDRAKIEVLLRRREPVAPKAKRGETLPNDLADDRFYQREEILTEKQVWSLAAGDLNGDGRIDVAYYGKPEELVVAFGDGKGGFPSSQTFPIEDGAATTGGLAVADMNGDGRADLLLLGKGYTAILHQGEKGTLLEPVKLPHGEKGIHRLAVRDLDGDGRADLVLLASASPRSVRARFGRGDGTLGPELAFETTPWRVLDVHDIDPAPGAEIVVVQRNSGVLRSLRLRTRSDAAQDPLALGSVEIHAFEETGSAKVRSMAIGDLDGDGRRDIVVTEPGTAQLALYMQGEGGTLHARRLFPTLAEAEAVRVADLDGDGRDEVVVLSGGDRAVGLSRLGTDGRLPFPTMLPVAGTPKAIDTADFDGDGRKDLVVAVERDKKQFALVYLGGAVGGPPAIEVDLKGLKAAPDDIMGMDLNQDGRTDLLCFDRFGPMRVWLRGEGQLFVDLSAEGESYRGGLVSKIARGNVHAGDLDGNGKAELLVASQNFARALRLGAGGGLEVTDQANGRSPRSQVKGVVSLDLDGDGKADVALYDGEKDTVSLLTRNASGVFEIRSNLAVGEFEFQALHAADMNGDGRPDLVILGKNRFGILYGGGASRDLVELHSVESSRRDARLGKFAVGDLNGDGTRDLAVLDGGNRGIQIFSYTAAKGFLEELFWRAYEKKMHDDNRRDGGADEILVDDLDGDGKFDIAILIHDRLIVYPQ